MSRVYRVVLALTKLKGNRKVCIEKFNGTLTVESNRNLVSEEPEDMDLGLDIIEMEGVK